MVTFVITDTPEYQVDYDRSLIVVAANAREAIAFWQEFYELEEDEQPERVFKLDTRALEGNVGVIAWHSDQLPQVAGKFP